MRMNHCNNFAVYTAKNTVESLHCGSTIACNAIASYRLCLVIIILSPACAITKDHKTPDSRSVKRKTLSERQLLAAA